MKNYGLTTTVAITPAALQLLEDASELSGLPMGQLVTLAVESFYDPKNNPAYADVKNLAREAFSQRVLGA